MRALLVTFAVLAAGCLGPAAPGVDPHTLPAGLAVTPTAPGAVDVEVPVDVVLVGFAPGTAAGLAAALAPERVVHFASDDWRDVPPNPSRPPHAPTFKDAFLALPLTPVGVFRVHEMPASFAADLRAYAASTALNASVYDANAVEDWLAARLALSALPLGGQPPLVLLHLDQAPHAWRYTYPNGWLEPVRVFGERKPLLVLDVSADPDPYSVERNAAADAAYLALVGGTLEPVKAYEWPLAASGPETVAALAEAVVDATRFRLLHGSAVPPSLKPCQAITLVIAGRAGALSEHLPGYRNGHDLVDVRELDRGWEMLVGEGAVEVDLKVLRLPQDDPQLDLVSRTGFGAVGGTRGGYDAMRWWVTENWERYWVPHEGCEAYVSFVLVADPGDLAAGYSGIAMYDASDDRRISFSVVADWHRLASDQAGALFPLLDAVSPPRPEAEGEWRAFTYLFSHETGHLLGQHHPHNNQRPDRVELRSFSSVWTPMSYQAGERVTEFGTVERANWLRNRAGFALAAAEGAGNGDHPDAAAALARLAVQDWAGALDLLLPLTPSSRR